MTGVDPPYQLGIEWASLVSLACSNSASLFFVPVAIAGAACDGSTGLTGLAGWASSEDSGAVAAEAAAGAASPSTVRRKAVWRLTTGGCCCSCGEDRRRLRGGWRAGAGESELDATELARDWTEGGFGASGRGPEGCCLACWFASHLRRSADMTSACETGRAAAAAAGPRARSGGDALRGPWRCEADATDDEGEVLATFPLDEETEGRDVEDDAGEVALASSSAEKLACRERFPDDDGALGSSVGCVGSHGGESGWYGALALAEAGACARASCCCCCCKAAIWLIWA